MKTLSIVILSGFVLSASADLIVDLGSAKDFIFLDISSDPSIDATLEVGSFNGDIGWSADNGRNITVTGALTGDVYRVEGSELVLDGTHLGTDYASADMQGFIDDVNAAVDQFASLSQDQNLGSIDMSGDYTISRSDAYTVVDISTFKLSSGTLTIDGLADDVFYIRVSDTFELDNVDVVVNGTDSSRVFFIYDGSSDVKYESGHFLGNVIAPNAFAKFDKVYSFGGSIISGSGFAVEGSNENTVFDHTVAIPEPAVISLISLFGGGMIFSRRIFGRKKSDSGA